MLLFLFYFTCEKRSYLWVVFSAFSTWFKYYLLSYFSLLFFEPSEYYSARETCSHSEVWVCLIVLFYISIYGNGKNSFNNYIRFNQQGRSIYIFLIFHLLNKIYTQIKTKLCMLWEVVSRILIINKTVLILVDLESHLLKYYLHISIITSQRTKR